MLENGCYDQFPSPLLNAQPYVADNRWFLKEEEHSMHDRHVMLPLETSTNSQPSCTVLCGIATLKRLLIQELEQAGFHHDLDAAIAVIVDAPYGSALVTLETLDQTYRRVIVATENACPEYWDDLLSFQPAIVLTGRTWEQEIASAIRHAAQGKQYCVMPHYTSPLTARERIVLRYVARAYSNQQIGGIAGISEGSVGNVLTSIYAKLGLCGRGAAILYYLGRQDLLGNASNIRK